MRKLKFTVVLLPLLALALISLSPATAAAQDLKVLLIAEQDSSLDLEYMLAKEVGVMTEMLEEAGFEVMVATASGQPLAAETTTLDPAYKFAEVKTGEYAGFILPCMAVEHSEPIEPELAAILREAVELGTPVAAQFGGIYRLAQAGVMSGKQFAHIEEYAENPELKDAVYSGSHGIVKDGNVITSGVCPYAAREYDLPDGTTELTQTLITEMKARV